MNPFLFDKMLGSSEPLNPNMNPYHNNRKPTKAFYIICVFIGRFMGSYLYICRLNLEPSSIEKGNFQHRNYILKKSIHNSIEKPQSHIIELFIPEKTAFLMLDNDIFMINSGEQWLFSMNVEKLCLKDNISTISIGRLSDIPLKQVNTNAKDNIFTISIGDSWIIMDNRFDCIIQITLLLSFHWLFHPLLINQSMMRSYYG